MSERFVRFKQSNGLSIMIRERDISHIEQKDLNQVKVFMYPQSTTANTAYTFNGNVEDFFKEIGTIQKDQPETVPYARAIPQNDIKKK